MIFPPILEKIILSNSLISIVFALALLVFLTLRRRRPVADIQSDVMDALLIRIFLWMQLIAGALVLGGVLIESFSIHKHVGDAIEVIVPHIVE